MDLMTTRLSWPLCCPRFMSSTACQGMGADVKGPGGEVDLDRAERERVKGRGWNHITSSETAIIAVAGRFECLGKLYSTVSRRELEARDRSNGRVSSSRPSPKVPSRAGCTRCFTREVASMVRLCGLTPNPPIPSPDDAMVILQPPHTRPFSLTTTLRSGIV